MIAQMPNSLSTCWTMIQGAATGGEREREQFAALYAPVVRDYLGARWARSPLSAHLADAEQDVFVECFKQGGVLDRLDEITGFRRFLHGVARNVALRWEDRARRSREDQSPSHFDFDAVDGEEDSHSRVFDRAWARARLRDAVALLLERAEGGDEVARRRLELLHLRFYEGLPVREIARRWGEDADAVHREYARARRDFRAALMQVVTFHSPHAPDDAEREFEEILNALVR